MTAARSTASRLNGVNAHIGSAAKSQAFLAVTAQHPEIAAIADAANPMGRMGDPDGDIAPAPA
ncbi:hypothetical protein [Mycolicibacterium sarraceniae]|uniref:hypothetical protein n=1 Tax=Mycolicibacterium sarraceniae TaxID=1534348 RepID=UPI001F30E67E|nr:hypothetical protein [Mycolicibacterium sarraceniae]